jgi:hypothetical protein
MTIILASILSTALVWVGAIVSTIAALALPWCADTSTDRPWVVCLYYGALGIAALVLGNHLAQ